LPWYSDNSEDKIFDLVDNFAAQKKPYLGQFYNGIFWSDYVDILIGITNQPVSDTVGVCLDQIILVNWYCWDHPLADLQWADDNLIRHELSHLFGAPDHVPVCCVMASHEHFIGIIIEDGCTFIVCQNVPCCLTTDKWCQNCYDRIMKNRGKFGIPSGLLGTEKIPIDKLSLITPYVALNSAIIISFTWGKRKWRRS
jgi:hypothetical protein